MTRIVREIVAPPVYLRAVQLLYRRNDRLRSVPGDVGMALPLSRKGDHTLTPSPVEGRLVQARSPRRDEAIVEKWCGTEGVESPCLV